MSEAVIRNRESGVTDDTQKPGTGFAANALRVLRARYLKKDEQGRCTESPRDMFRRVAKAVAEAEAQYDSDPEIRSEWEDRFYALMMSRRFMPNSPTLMNAGREMGMLSACFVLPVGDSIDEIFDSIKHTALIQKAGGGTGFAFDELRPTGDFISSSGGGGGGGGRNHERSDFLLARVQRSHERDPTGSVPPRSQHGDDERHPSRHSQVPPR